MIRYSRWLSCLFVLALLAAVSPPAPADDGDGDRHRVQGAIPFSYDYAATLAAAKADGKPIFAYFTFEA